MSGIKVDFDGDNFLILSDEGEVRTPMGKPLRTPHRSLAEEIARDLEQLGSDPLAGESMYNCQCSLLDFGRMADRQKLINNSLVDVPEDPVLNTDIALLEDVLNEAFDQPYFEDAKLRESGVDKIIEWATRQLQGWSLEEIMVVQLVSAHLGSPLMGMALAKDKARIESAAFGFCGNYLDASYSERIGMAMSIFGLPSHLPIPAYYPKRSDREFCNRTCLANFVCIESGPLSVMKAKLPMDFFKSKCGLAIAMDVWRRFAAFGRLNGI
jgi:hypothetical protein